jgi:DHA1 family multidrug resistance protein-like MFS transporter
MKGRMLVVLNLSIVSAVMVMGFNVVSPILPQYALTFQVSVAMAGWVVSAFSIARLMVNLPAGVMADRFGRKRVMALGLLLVAASSAFTGLANSYWMLIIGRIIQGTGSAIYMTSAMTWVAQVSTGEYRGRLMALYNGLVQVGQVFGPTIGGYAAVYYGLRAPFFVYGAMALLGLLATIPLKEPRGSADDKKTALSIDDVRFMMRSTSFILVGLAGFAIFSMRSGVRFTLIPLYGDFNLGLSAETIGFLLTLSAVVTVLLIMPAGWLVDRIGRKVPSIISLLLSVTAIMLMPLFPVTSWFVFALILYGLGEGFQAAVAAWIADLAPEGKMGAAIGFYRVLGDLGMVLGPIVVTYTADYVGGDTLNILPFIGAASIPFIAGILLFGAADVYRRKRKTATGTTP